MNNDKMINNDYNNNNNNNNEINYDLEINEMCVKNVFINKNIIFTNSLHLKSENIQISLIIRIVMRQHELLYLANI